MRSWIFLFILLLFSCGQRYIAGTRVPDTPENRVIAELVERYRVAIEKRDIETLKEMVSRKYFTLSGTVSDPSDDYGYEQLEKKVFPSLKEQVKSIQLAIFLRKIEVQGNHAKAEFEYYYKFFYVDGGKDRWLAKSDFQRLEFEKEDGVWRIVSGL